MKKIIWVSNLIIGLLVLAGVFAVFLVRMSVVGQTGSVREPADAGWYYEDGSDARLSDLQFREDKVRISRRIGEEWLQSADLCFTTNNIDFSVYLNGKVIYDFHPQMRLLYGETYGVAFHTINLPAFSEEAELVIEVEDLVHGKMWSGFGNAWFEDGTDYLHREIRANLLNLFLSFLIFVAGFIVVVLGVMLRYHEEQRMETIALGVMTMVLSMWTASGSFLFAIIRGNPGIVRCVNYFSLIILPIPWIAFVAALTQDTKSKIVKLVMGITCLNLVLHIVMLVTGRMDYHDLLPFTHFIFVAGVCATIFLVVRSRRREQFLVRQWLLIFHAYLFLMLSGVADLIYYYVVGGENVAKFSRYGLLLFVLLLFAHEAREFFYMAQKNYEVGVMRKLAHEDGLTGLENRLSFNEFEEELQSRDSGRCIFIQFDINNLKKVNDNYGHIAGDAFIKAGAEAIADSFGKYGRVFRTGGDEFISVFLLGEAGENMTALYEECVHRMEQQIERYNREENPPLPLTIAYGMAECDLASGELLAGEMLADERMYECKRRIKLMDA